MYGKLVGWVLHGLVETKLTQKIFLNFDREKMALETPFS